MKETTPSLPKIIENKQTELNRSSFVMTDTAIPREVINDKILVIKDRLLNPNKYRSNVTRRNVTEQRIYESIRQYNMPSQNYFQRDQAQFFVGRQPSNDYQQMYDSKLSISAQSSASIKAGPSSHKSYRRQTLKLRGKSNMLSRMDSKEKV